MKKQGEENMEQENINKLYDLIKNIPITEKNADVIEELKEDIKNKDYENALQKIKSIRGKYKVEEETLENQNTNEQAEEEERDAKIAI